MTKKGFTLVELIAVITLIGLFLLIAIPTVDSLLSRQKEKLYEIQRENIQDALKIWGNTYVERLPEDDGDSIYVTLSQLKKEGLVEEDIANPKTNACYSNGNVFTIKRKGEGYTYFVKELIDGIESDCTVNTGPVCKRATVLHTEECEKIDETKGCGAAGYSTSGIKGTTTITYGNLGVSGTLASGDAFDCDVNGDGVYDSATERFYYVSDYYNTVARRFEEDKATLIYYISTGSGIPNANSNIAYYVDTKENWHGPATAVTNLPTLGQWSNVSLINNKRWILTEISTYETTGGFLPDLDYASYAARLLTAQELESACSITIGRYGYGELDNCNYLMENTRFASSTIWVNGFWLENPYSSRIDLAWYAIGSARFVGAGEVTFQIDISARPVIELYKTDIEY